MADSEIPEWWPQSLGPYEDHLDQLATFVKTTVAVDQVFLGACLAQATALVANRVGSVEVPPTIHALAIREVAADIFHRRRVRNGVAGFDSAEFSPIRVTRDPMKAAVDILGPWMGPGIA